MTEEISQNELLALRRAKLDDLRSKGNAFPNDFKRDALAEDLHTSYDSLEKEKLDKEGKFHYHSRPYRTNTSVHKVR